MKTYKFTVIEGTQVFNGEIEAGSIEEAKQEVIDIYTYELGTDEESLEITIESEVITMKANVGTTQYYPELGAKKPISEIEATYSGFMGKYRLKTPLELKGRGIKYDQTYNEQNCNNPSKYGWNIYYATKSAFEKLEKEYAISQELLFD